MSDLNIDSLKKSGLSFEDIEGIKRGLNDVKKGKIYEEDDFYTKLESEIFSKKNTYV